jgi:hypothetical protein
VAAYNFAPKHNPPLIAVGLLILLAASAIQGLPIAIGFALVALGATGATVCHPCAEGRSVIVVHLVTYVTLYFLLLCAMWDLATRNEHGGLRIVQMLDVAISAALMILVAYRCLSTVLERGNASSR